jgi:hypothetical protein
MRWGLGVLVLAAVAAGMVPDAAQAKQVRSVVVCGASGCRSVSGTPGFLDLFNVYLPQTHRPDRGDRARWFLVRVKITVPGTTLPPETWITRFYPSTGVIHERADAWRKVPRSSLAAYHQAAAEIVPFGARSSAIPARQTRPAVPPTDVNRTTVPALVIAALGTLALACAVIGAWSLVRRRGRRQRAVEGSPRRERPSLESTLPP